MITSLISGLPRRETCCHGPPASTSVPFALSDAELLAAGRRPTRRGRRRGRSGRSAPRGPLVSCRSGTLDGDRVRVEPADAIDAGLGRERDGMEGVERAQAGQVEDRAEVDEEGVVTLAGEEPGPVGQRLDRRRGKGLVVGRRARPDVGRRRRDVRRDLVAVAPDVVGLPDEQVRVVQAGDRTVVVEEGRDPREVRGLAMGLEPELVADVGLAVAVVVDVDLVADASGRTGRSSGRRPAPRAGCSWR